MKRRFVKARYLSFLTFSLLTACVTAERDEAPEAASSARRHDFGSVLGQSPILLKGKKIVRQTTTKDAPKVNKFLWQSALSVVGFMPILCAMPQTGRIATDWYSDPDTPSVRVRVAILILGTELRADAVKVYVERQKLNSKKFWKNYRLPAKKRVKLEMLIVERARRLLKTYRHPEEF